MVKYKSLPNNGEDTTSSGLDPVILEIFVIDLFVKKNVYFWVTHKFLFDEFSRFDMFGIVTFCL